MSKYQNLPDLQKLLGAQRLVVTRTQALEAGMSKPALYHRIRAGGPWQTLLPRVYLAATGTPTVAQRDVAAVLYAGPGAMLTGLAALRYHGVRVPQHDHADVLVPATRNPAGAGYVRVHRTARMPTQRLFDGAVRYAPAPRALADAARLLPSYGEVRALVADAIQRGKCPPHWIADELNEGPTRGSAKLRRVMDEIAAGTRSVAEAELRPHPVAVLA